MQKEEKKILNILDTLNAYCIFVGAKSFNVSLEKNKKEWKISVKSDFLKSHAKGISELENRINNVKCDHTEEMYYAFIGGEDFKDDHDIDVIACMIDEAKVNIIENTFEATFIRKINK